MPSPFPGMDPFIEMQEWSDFHPSAIGVIREALNAVLPERYVARAERRIYFAGEIDSEIFVEAAVPDAAVLEERRGRRRNGGLHASAAVGALATPIRCRWPQRIEHREAWLEIRDVESKRIVTLIELLSPANKARGHKGRRLYLRKREKARSTNTSFVEVDLLRGGSTVLNVQPRPECDYYAMCAPSWRQSVDVYAWTLREPLPTIRIPLRKNEQDAPLDLQHVLQTVYDRGRYGRSLDYRAKLRPPLSPDDAEWCSRILDAHRLTRRK